MARKWLETRSADPSPVIATASEPTAESDVERLLARMRGGDREAAAAFIMQYGSRIRRRVRGKLNPSMRRLFDSQEILSTLGRRLDVYVRAGHLEAMSEGQLWKLVYQMADHAVIDKARIYRRLRQCEREDSPFAHELMRRLEEAERDDDAAVAVELQRAIKGVTDSTDRQILELWLTGMAHCEIAPVVDLSAAAVRQRWRKIRANLRHRLGGEEN